MQSYVISYRLESPTFVIGTGSGPLYVRAYRRGRYESSRSAPSARTLIVSRAYLMSSSPLPDQPALQMVFNNSCACVRASRRGPTTAPLRYTLRAFGAEHPWQPQ